MKTLWFLWSPPTITFRYSEKRENWVLIWHHKNLASNPERSVSKSNHCVFTRNQWLDQTGALWDITFYPFKWSVSNQYMPLRIQFSKFLSSLKYSTCFYLNQFYNLINILFSLNFSLVVRFYWAPSFTSTTLGRFMSCNCFLTFTTSTIFETLFFTILF